MTGSTRAFSAGVEDVARETRQLAGVWQGAAADAATATMVRELGIGRDVVDVLARGGRLLRDGAMTLASARAAMLATVDSAIADGCRVDDDGTAHPPVVPKPVGRIGDPSYLIHYADIQARHDRAVAQAASMAAAHTRAIKASLAACQNADADVAGQLSGVTLPAALADEAAGLVERVVPGAGAQLLPVQFPAGWSPWRAMSPGTTAEWLSAVSPGLVCLPGLIFGTGRPPTGASTGYYGGGFLTGPDGRRYPLIVPRLNVGGIGYGADAFPTVPRVQDLGGRDPGWHQIGFDYGIDRFGTPTSVANKAVVGFAGITGANVSSERLDGLRLRHDLLKNLRISPDGYPSLDTTPSRSPEHVGIPAGDPRDNPLDPAPADAAGYHPDRFGRAQTAVDVLITAGDTIHTVQHLDDPLDHAYTLTLEQNDDGRRRALLGVYDTLADQDGKTIITPSYGYLNSSHMLDTSPMTFRFSGNQSILSPSDVTVRQVR